MAMIRMKHLHSANEYPVSSAKTRYLSALAYLTIDTNLGETRILVHPAGIGRQTP